MEQSLVHDDRSHLQELRSLERFSKKIADHISGGAVLDGDFVSIDAVLDKEETQIYVTGALGTRRHTVLRQQDGTLVVLINNIYTNMQSLGH